MTGAGVHAPIIFYHWVLQLPFLGGGSLVVGGVGCSVHRVGGVGRVVTILEGDMASPLLKFPFLLISCALLKSVLSFSHSLTILSSSDWSPERGS